MFHTNVWIALVRAVGIHFVTINMSLLNCNYSLQKGLKKESEKGTLVSMDNDILMHLRHNAKLLKTSSCLHALQTDQLYIFI